MPVVGSAIICHKILAMGLVHTGNRRHCLFVVMRLMKFLA